MYVNSPAGTKIGFRPSTPNRLEAYQDHDEKAAPTNVEQFLAKLGWNITTYNPDNEEPLYRKPSDSEIGDFYFTWYQALAYEWFRTISLGG